VHSWLLSTVLALGPATGPNRVELDVSGLEHHMDEEALHRFHGELLMRLLEVGHGVGADGNVVLSLTSAGDTIVVECRVDDRRERVEVDDAEAAVLGLELVHRAVDVVDRCATAGGSTDGLIIDSDGSIESSALIVELADTPITLIVDERVAAWRLCVRERGMFVVPIEIGCEQGSSSVASDPRSAIEQWQAQTVTPPAIVDAAPEAAERPANVPPPKPIRPPAWGASLGAAAGVLLRFPGVSASVHVDVAALHRSGVFVGALGSLAPSRAEQLAAIDALGLATVGWRGRVSDRVALSPSLGLGVAVHRFRYEDEPVGHLVDLAVRIPLELQVRVAPRLYASFAIAGTASTRRIEHLLGDTTIWARGVFRLEALLGLRFIP
jgi:hypothetical protein